MKKQQNLSLDDLFTDLPGLSYACYMAIIFAAYQEFSFLEEVTLLRWTDLKELSLNWRSEKILHTHPRHIKSPFIFWELNEDNRAVPITDLCQRVNLVTSLTWGQISQKYREALPIDFATHQALMQNARIFD